MNDKLRQGKKLKVNKQTILSDINGDFDNSCSFFSNSPSLSPVKIIAFV